MSFQVTPDALYFPPPLDKNIERMIQIRSQSDAPTTFKIKTTKPERYSVKPRMGFITPNGERIVQITYRVRGKDNAGWKPEDHTRIEDRFQLELRLLDGDKEKEAFRLVQAADFAQASKLVAPEETPTMSPTAGPRDDEADVAAYLWKKPTTVQVHKWQLKCIYAQKSGATNLSSNADMRGAPLVTARGAPSGGGDDARAQDPETRRLQDQRHEYYLKAQEQQAMMQELRSKSESKGPHISGWLFVLLTLACFYLGLVLDKYFFSPAEPGGGGEL
eukprot:TRINITY_DN28468_c0_g1_i5.p1 TRINITY_DN28468_c0_g1~~TRINITY_DN28468_c0_g1_i5.p1  ORF type:complete len:306 (+),score=113.42 TRINITY_DN28468_c0_g1_i5:94-918(+)